MAPGLVEERATGRRRGRSATVSDFYGSSGTPTDFSSVPSQMSYCRRTRRHLTAQLNSNGLVSIEQLTFGKPIII